MDNQTQIPPLIPIVVKTIKTSVAVNPPANQELTECLQAINIAVSGKPFGNKIDPISKKIVPDNPPKIDRALQDAHFRTRMGALITIEYDLLSNGEKTNYRVVSIKTKGN